MLIQTKRLGLGAWNNKKQCYTVLDTAREIERIIRDEYYSACDIRIRYALNKYLTIPEFLQYMLRFEIVDRHDKMYQYIFKACYSRGDR